MANLSKFRIFSVTALLLALSSQMFGQWTTTGTVVHLSTTSNNVSVGGTTATAKLQVNGSGLGISSSATGTAVQGLGNIGVRGGTTAFVSGIGVWGTSSSSSSLAGKFDGNVQINGDLTVTGIFSNPSDRKFKSNVQPLSSALDKLMLLKPSTYNFKTKEFSQFSFPEGVQPGLIADEVAQVFPVLVKEQALYSMQSEDGKDIAGVKTDYKSVNYLGLIPYLVAGIQEQQLLIEERDEKIAALEARLAKLEERISGTTPRESITPDGLKATNNRPNPFSDITTVDFNLPTTVKQAQLVIVDAIGKEVLRKELEQRGPASIEVNMKNQSAGVYYYFIQSDGVKTTSQKMVVQK